MLFTFVPNMSMTVTNSVHRDSIISLWVDHESAVDEMTEKERGTKIFRWTRRLRTEKNDEGGPGRNDNLVIFSSLIIQSIASLARPPFCQAPRKRRIFASKTHRCN